MYRRPVSCCRKEYATARENSIGRVECPPESPQDALTEILRRGARQLLAQAVEAEVEGWLDFQFPSRPL